MLLVPVVISCARLSLVSRDYNYIVALPCVALSVLEVASYIVGESSKGEGGD